MAPLTKKDFREVQEILNKLPVEAKTKLALMRANWVAEGKLKVKKGK
jgi:hypothetical protein